MKLWLGKGTENEKGAALIIVLFLLASLSAVAILMSTSQRQRITGLYTSQSAKQAQWFAIGAEDLSRALVELDRKASSGIDRLNSRWAAQAVKFPLERGYLEATMRDATSCFNLNGIVKGTAADLSANDTAISEFDHLLQALSLDTRAREALTDVLVDWLDADSIPRASGAEDFEYGGESAGFRTANGLIADISELRSMFWYSPAVFRLLKPYICVHPEAALTSINVNMITAQKLPLLYAVLRGKIPMNNLQSGIAARPEQGFTTLDEFWEVFPEDQQEDLRATGEGRVTLWSKYIELETTIRHDQITLRGHSLLRTEENGRSSTVSRKFVR